MSWIADLSDPGARAWEELYRSRHQHDRVVRSTHGVNCTGSCSWNVHVKDGVVAWESQARDYPRLESPEAFRDWSEPGTVRVLFGHWVEPDGDGSVLFSEARVSPVDRRASLRLRSLWTVIGPFERLIGAEPLALAAARA
jgi:hypothetical protein